MHFLPLRRFSPFEPAAAAAIYFRCFDDDYRLLFLPPPPPPPPPPAMLPPAGYAAPALERRQLIYDAGAMPLRCYARRCYMPDTGEMNTPKDGYDGVMRRGSGSVR